VLFSVGVRPELTLARQAGLEIGTSGGLVVDDHLRTSDPNIFAAGDMIEVLHKISGLRMRVPLAGPANRQGRIAASNALGLDMRYTGVLGSSVLKILDATAAITGLSEKAARAAGFSVGVAVITKDNHAGYYPGGKELTIKLVYDRTTARLLGAQAFGYAGVDKRIDVLATALNGGQTLADLAEVDLAYAPPYSSANDPVNIAAFVGLNDLSGFSPLMTASELKNALRSADPPVLLDVRTLNESERSHLKGAIHIPVDELRFELEAVPKGRPIAVYCQSGFRAHLAVRILKGNGYSQIVNVTGGYHSIIAEGGFELEEA
jgi:rhodanese-related sulfurtransferase